MKESLKRFQEALIVSKKYKVMYIFEKGGSLQILKREFNVKKNYSHNFNY